MNGGFLGEGLPDRRIGQAATSAAYRISGPVPAIFHEDPLFLGLCAAFDELLGPVVTALDCFAAYLDPWLAPGDFLAWLGTLVGVSVSPGAETGPDASDRHRALIAGAVRAYQARGTAAGLRDVVAAAVGVTAEQVSVADVPTGGGVWAPTIRYHDGVFYVIVTVAMSPRGCVVFTAADPATKLPRKMVKASRYRE